MLNTLLTPGVDFFGKLR